MRRGFGRRLLAREFRVELRLQLCVEPAERLRINEGVRIACLLPLALGFEIEELRMWPQEHVRVQAPHLRKRRTKIGDDAWIGFWHQRLARNRRAAVEEDVA